MNNIVESQLVKNQRTADYEEPLTEPCETQSLKEDQDVLWEEAKDFKSQRNVISAAR